MSRMLIEEPPRTFSPSLAAALGDALQAIILQQIHWWCWLNEKSDHERFFIDGHWWTMGTIDKWQARDFPWVSSKTIHRAIRKLEDAGLLISTSKVYDSFDHTKWYRVDREALKELDERFGQSVHIGLDDESNPARDQDTPAPVFERTPIKEHLKEHHHDDRKSKEEHPVNTESKETEPPKSPVETKGKGSTSTPRRADPEQIASPWMHGCPKDVGRPMLPEDQQITFAEFRALFVEYTDTIPRAPRSMWVLDHYTRTEIIDALSKTANGADKPCWAYFRTVLEGLDEAPAAKSRRTGGGGIKPPPKTRFDQESLQWVEVES